MPNQNEQKFDANDLAQRIETLAKLFFKPIQELYYGIVKGSLPWFPCLCLSMAIQLIVLTKLDIKIWKGLDLLFFYPTKETAFWMYYVVIVSSPFFLWAIIQVGIKKRLTKKLTEKFLSCGLKNNLGHLPHFIFDVPIDSVTRKLRLTSAVLPLSEFERAKPALNTGLQIFIDEIRENRVDGTVDIIYAMTAMPEMVKLTLESIRAVGSSKFVVGETRAKKIIAHLDQVPHLLIAGQTGKGKSTFLRQLITTLYLNNKGSHFTLVDLKGGLEFQTFENLPNVDVPNGMQDALYKIQKIAETLEQRMKLLKVNKAKDLIEYWRKPESERVAPDGTTRKIELHRHFIIIDEAAEMFLSGHHATSKDIQTAKRVLSTVARQGRSVGIHLVIATQRPDTKALDSQIKANLTGVICFQMANDASSMTVLGNGRATDLPASPGRAIWKEGRDMFEIQTPFLDKDGSEKILKNYYLTADIKNTAVENQIPPQNSRERSGIEFEE